MVYLNQCENSFDIGSFSFTDGYLTDGNPVRKYLDAPSGSKYYISYDVMLLTGTSSNYFFMANSTSGTCFSNFTKYQDTITLETQNDVTVKSLSIEKNKWYRVYEVFDYVEGYVEMFIEGELFARTTDVAKKPISYIELRLKGVAIKNLIISDTEIPKNLEVIKLSTEINSEWNNGKDCYFTDDTDKKITVTAEVPEGCSIYEKVICIKGIRSGSINSLSINGEKYNVESRIALSVPVEDLSNIELKGVLD